MRRIFLALPLLCISLALLFTVYVRARSATPVPPLGATLGQPPPTQVAAVPVQVLFVDESVTWDWENACDDEVVAYVAGNRLPVAHLLYTLSDDDDLALGVAWPDAEQPEAVALGQCAEEGDILACRVSVNAGDPGPALDTALTALLAYSVHDYFRVKSEENWGSQSAWNWADYVPLVVENAAGWMSACMEVEK
jgi:hypothetical protein